MEHLQQAVVEAKRIALISHINPDGDAVSSVLGMHLALEQIGKVVTSVLRDDRPGVFAFLPDLALNKTLPMPDEVDLLIVLDAGDASRTGFTNEIKAYSKTGKLAYVDHHPKGDLARLTQVGYHDETVSSTAELVYNFVTQFPIKITPTLATCLLTGIFTDTGGFQYQNTSTTTLGIAADLMRRGARLNTVTSNISQKKSVANLKLLGIALERIRLTHEGKLATSVITQGDIEGCSALPEDLGGIIGELNVLPGVEAALLLSETEPGVIRGSLRTGEGYKTKVNLLAKLMGGGGHPKAAGFMVAGHIVEDAGTWKIV